MKFILEFACFQGRKLSRNRLCTVGLTITSGDVTGTGVGIVTALAFPLIMQCRYAMCFSGIFSPMNTDKQRVLMHGHQGWNVRHGLCHIYMIYVYIWVVHSFCLFCCLFIIVTTQFVALYEPCEPKPKPKPSTYDTRVDNHPLAEIQIPILRPEPKQQICHQHANTDHFGK